jgi:photosystem II stability/assembly factor-like uncharacterized protein
MRRITFSLWLLFCLLITSTVSAQQLDLSKLGGLKFRNIGPAGMSGRVTAIDVNQKDPRIMFVGTASGGVWRSTDRGISWKPVFDKQKVLSIGAITIDQHNPDIIWVGTGEGDPRNSVSSGYGLYRSLDGGDTWQLMGLEKTRNIYRIIVSPDNSDIVYVGAIGSPWGASPDRGLYRTQDGGKSWKKILYVNDQTGVADMVMDPSNPKKIFVAMWQYRRWPWFFKSGGPGSGLYVTYDGGDHFTQITAKNGLPGGELGRMGLAVAASNPKVVYALIEAKKNGFYRSDDGGKTWHLRTTKNIGGRPFYFSNIYVDPKNENNVYTLFTRVNKSIDGGKTFQPLIGRNIHPDHHSWWISPVNPKFMMDGNDGGLAITYDQGKTWRYVQNLPVGQFYHVNVDNDLPYHVYGGMQDNGSWRGPGYVWARGGIINAYWQNLMGGDGFDVVPDPSDNRYCYAMWQQGNIGRVDLKTGYVKGIRPVLPNGKRLRCNWNTAIAADPFDKNGLYFGSQFLHHTTDHGNSWAILSPDLTTNDTAKQKQSKSGGLTFDATGAENYTTITAIGPSTVQKGVIWVGTDDGNIQLTKDGGKHWENVVKKMKGLPQGSWTAQIDPSTYHAGEAFVVMNNYRQHDFSPYLYHTTNFGKSWENMVSKDKIFGYCLSFVQDPVEPRLMFLGTSSGLYVSIDGGQNWSHWTNHFPAGVPTRDMVIQPREADLVVATFGRSIFILDDIRPLRELAARGTTLLEQPIHAFKPPVAYEASWKGEPGVFAGGASYFHGQNKPMGALLTFSVKQGTGKTASGNQQFAGPWQRPGGHQAMSKVPPSKKVTIKVINSEGQTIRTLSMVPKTGINRINWALDRKGFRFPGSPKPRKNSVERGGGGYVIPGTYKLVFSYQGHFDSTQLTVKSDPRLAISAEDMKANYALVHPVMKKLQALTKAVDRLRESKKIMQEVKNMLPQEKGKDLASFKKLSKATGDSIRAINNAIFPPRNVQGLYSNPKLLMTKLRSVYGVIFEKEPLTATQKLALHQAQKDINAMLMRIDNFYNISWKAYKEAAENMHLSPFNKEKKEMPHPQQQKPE